MLGGEHALLERRGVSSGLDRHFGLAEHLAGIELLGDDVDRAAADCVAGLDRARVRVEARDIWAAAKGGC